MCTGAAHFLFLSAWLPHAMFMASAVTKASMPQRELESTGVLQPYVESGVEGNLPAAEVSPSHAPQLKVVHPPTAWLRADPWERAWAPVLLPMPHSQPEAELLRGYRCLSAWAEQCIPHVISFLETTMPFWLALHNAFPKADIWHTMFSPQQPKFW